MQKLMKVKIGFKLVIQKIKTRNLDKHIWVWSIHLYLNVNVSCKIIELVCVTQQKPIRPHSHVELKKNHSNEWFFKNELKLLGSNVHSNFKSKS